MVIFGRKAPQLLGVDIGSKTVKVVELIKQKKRIFLQNYGVAPLRESLVIDNNITDTEKMGEVIAQLVHEIDAANVKKIKHKKAAIAVPNSAVMAKVISVDAGLTQAELEAQIRLDCASHIPYSLTEMSLDFVSLPFSHIQNSQGITHAVTEQHAQSVLLVASRTEQVDQRVDALVFSGLSIQVVDVEAHALQRGLLSMLLPRTFTTTEKKPNTAVDTYLKFGFPFALIQVEEDNLKTFTLYVFEGNEQIYSREHVWEADPYGAVISAILFYHSSKEQSVNSVISAVFLSGSVLVNNPDWAAKTQAALSEKLSAKVIVANPFINIGIAPHINKQRLYEDAPLLLNAFGLALRSSS